MDGILSVSADGARCCADERVFRIRLGWCVDQGGSPGADPGSRSLFHMLEQTSGLSSVLTQGISC